jgi:hypothetical protein
LSNSQRTVNPVPVLCYRHRLGNPSMGPKIDSVIL